MKRFCQNCGKTFDDEITQFCPCCGQGFISVDGFDPNNNSTSEKPDLPLMGIPKPSVIIPPQKKNNVKRLIVLGIAVLILLLLLFVVLWG